MTAFLGQQHRWTKGLIQTAKKLLPRILFSRAPLKVKLEAWFHLTSPIMYLVMFLVTAIALPAMFLATPFTDQADLALAVGLGTLLLGTFGGGHVLRRFAARSGILRCGERSSRSRC